MQTVIERELTAYEMERGKPMPSKNHSKLEKRLVIALSVNYQEKYEILPELSLELPTGRAVPDVAICEITPSDWLEDEIRVTQVPFGVIEIMSPSQSDQEMVDKLDIYFEAGVKSCWIVIPTFQTIHVFSSKRQYRTFTREKLTDDRLGIELDLIELFR
ncbi:MAG: Uma2 family endonuclease [Spirosomataceae bacterium]